MSKSIGIDLGTTNSVVALKKIETEILANAEGELLTPSVVSVQKKGSFLKTTKMLVGKHALDWMLQDPENSIVSVKRLMGRGFSDNEIQQLISEKRFDYKLQALSNASEQSLCVLLNEQEYTPEQISAKILEKLKQDSEKQLGEKVDYVVVTVPAYFNDKQKVATRRAATLAKLKVQRLLPEPTAAAISFGVDNMQAGEAKTVMVYDLGGGTFDISILTISDGQFIEQGKGGDMWMGGDDIDNLIRQYVYSETEKENEVENLPSLIEQMTPSDKNRFLGEIKKKVEEAKIKLSTSEKAYIDILGLLKDEDGDIIDIDVELSREKFEQLLKPFVERTVSLSKKLITNIGFDLDLVDQVILVGGSSNIPLVVQEIKQLFGEDKVLVHPRPMLAIAEGAAILAHRLSDSYECPQCGHEVAQDDKICSSCQFNLEDNQIEKGLLDIVHTSSHDYFLELDGGENYKLAEQNTPLPFHAHFSFKLLSHEQRLAHLKFSNEVNEKQESIGSIWLTFKLPDGEYFNENNTPEIQLDFEIDINNLITVTAYLEEYPDITVSKTLSRGGVDEQLFLELENSINKVNNNEDDTDFFVSFEFLNRSLDLAEDINQLVDSDTGNVNKKRYKEIVKGHRIALDIFDNDESFLGNMHYLDNIMSSFSFLLTDNEKKKIENKINIFKEKTKNSELNEIVKARDRALKEMDKHPTLEALSTINHAKNLCSDDPNQYQYFSHAIDKIIAYLGSDEDENEEDKQFFQKVLSDASIVRETKSKKNLHIFKGVQV